MLPMTSPGTHECPILLVACLCPKEVGVARIMLLHVVDERQISPMKPSRTVQTFRKSESVG